MANDPFDGVVWHDASKLGLGGLGWCDEVRENPYDRFPAAMRDQVAPKLWDLSTWAAGICVTFRTSARNLYVRWTLDEIDERPVEAYQAACARSGMDCYGRDESENWRWVGTKEAWREPKCDGRLNNLPLDGIERDYRVYFPLMRRVLRAEIGACETILPSSKDRRLPIAYYGTSIVHGAVVSRPGMTHAAQLGRLLQSEVVNLGFCGRAWCEPEVAAALSRLQPALYVIDVLPNNSAADLLQRLPVFLRILRNARPDTPVLLVGDRMFGDAAFMPERRRDFAAKNAAQEQAVQMLRDEGMEGLHLARHPDWFGADGEGSTDGSHPNDLGATRMAAALAPMVADYMS